MQRNTLLVLPCLLFPLAIGCVDSASPDDTSEQTADLAQQCPVSGTRVDHSLAVTDPKVLAKFSFARTMKQILASSGASPSETATQLYQQWMSTFGSADCANPKIDPNHYGEVCPRSHEFKLAGVDPIDPASKVQFVPVGLFNRFDLAPTSGATCGEYRIVYAMKSTDPNIGGRGFYIFEAAMPNPVPGLGLVGCLGIAEFWQNLSNIKDSTKLANTLEKFYYLGTAIENVGPVVDAHNYGLAVNGGAYTAGQIRSNMFIDGFQWHLREFKTDVTLPPDGTSNVSLAIDHVSVKTNPANELFDGTAKRSAGFLNAFPKQVKALASTEIATIGMTIGDQFNEFESISHPGARDVLYDQLTDTALQNAIAAQLAKLGSSLQVGDILRRATTQTCAGCHQLSSGNEAQLGGGLTWPASLGFVQINEQSQLSTALKSFFLPHRLTVLEDFINAHCGPGGGAVVDDGLTIGGSPVGAAN